MQKFYFYKEEDIKFLKDNHWKFNEEKGYWEKGHVKLYPKHSELNYILKFPGYGEIQYQSQIDTIIKLQEHKFGSCCERNNFRISGEWYDGKQTHIDSNGHTIIGAWPRKEILFDEDMAYDFIFNHYQNLEEAMQVTSDEEEDEYDFQERCDAIETEEDLREELTEKQAVDYCEKLYNKRNKAFIKYIEPKIAPAYMVWIGSYRVNISTILRG